MEEIIYRVFAESPASCYSDFENREEAEKFRDEEYFGPIEIIFNGEVVGHF